MDFIKEEEENRRHGLIFYDGLCCKAERKFRLSKGLVSAWEKKELVAEFCRAGKKNIRTPSGLNRSLSYLFEESGLFKGPCLYEQFNSKSWKDMFAFLSDRLSSIKQEFVISALGPSHLPILLTIANFYLFAILDPMCDYHKCYSEAYSTVCYAVQVYRTQHRELGALDHNILIYHFFLNMDDSTFVARLLQQGDINRFPMSLCADIYKSFKSCNYHRFWILWDSLDCLKQAALSKHARYIAKRAECIITKAYKSKNFRFSEDKYLRYTCKPLMKKEQEESQDAINTSNEELDLRYNCSNLPKVNMIYTSL